MTNIQEIQDQTRERDCNFYGRFQARIIFQTCSSRVPHVRRNRIQTNETKKELKKILRDPAYKPYGHTTHSNGNKINLEIAFHERNTHKSMEHQNKIQSHPSYSDFIKRHPGIFCFHLILLDIATIHCCCAAQHSPLNLYSID